MTNFEVFLQNSKLSTNLLFLKSVDGHRFNLVVHIQGDQQWIDPILDRYRDYQRVGCICNLVKHHTLQSYHLQQSFQKKSRYQKNKVLRHGWVTSDGLGTRNQIIGYLAVQLAYTQHTVTISVHLVHLAYTQHTLQQHTSSEIQLSGTQYHYQRVCIKQKQDFLCLFKSDEQGQPRLHSLIHF